MPVIPTLGRFRQAGHQFKCDHETLSRIEHTRVTTEQGRGSVITPKKSLGSEWRELWLLDRSSSIPQCGILHKDCRAEELNTWPFKMCLIKWQLASPVLWSMILIPLIHQHWRALALHQALSAALGSHRHENQPVCRAWRTEGTQMQG